MLARNLDDNVQSLTASVPNAGMVRRYTSAMRTASVTKSLRSTMKFPERRCPVLREVQGRMTMISRSSARNQTLRCLLRPRILGTRSSTSMRCRLLRLRQELDQSIARRAARQRNTSRQLPSMHLHNQRQGQRVHCMFFLTMVRTIAANSHIF